MSSVGIPCATGRLDCKLPIGIVAMGTVGAAGAAASVVDANGFECVIVVALVEAGAAKTEAARAPCASAGAEESPPAAVGSLQVAGGAAVGCALEMLAAACAAAEGKAEGKPAGKAVGKTVAVEAVMLPAEEVATAAVAAVVVAAEAGAAVIAAVGLKAADAAAAVATLR